MEIAMHTLDREKGPSRVLLFGTEKFADAPSLLYDGKPTGFEDGSREGRRLIEALRRVKCIENGDGAITVWPSFVALSVKPGTRRIDLMEALEPVLQGTSRQPAPWITSSEPLTPSKRAVYLDATDPYTLAFYFGTPLGIQSINWAADGVVAGFAAQARNLLNALRQGEYRRFSGKLQPDRLVVTIDWSSSPFKGMNLPGNPSELRAYCRGQRDLLLPNLRVLVQEATGCTVIPMTPRPA